MTFYLKIHRRNERMYTYLLDLSRTYENFSGVLRI